MKESLIAFIIAILILLAVCLSPKFIFEDNYKSVNSDLKGYYGSKQ